METQLTKIASGLGALQGLAYGILSLICIILYNTATPHFSLDTYMGAINFAMYGFFIGSNISWFEDQTFTPRTFAGFVWIHFVLNLLWIAVSVQTFLGKRFSLERNRRYWSLVTAAVCFWDFLTVVIIGSDYDKCLGHYDGIGPYSGLEVVCASGLLPVMVIAAKGFVLWIVNAAFAWILYRMSRQSNTGNKSTLQNPPMTLQNQYVSNPKQEEYPVGQAQYPTEQRQYPAGQGQYGAGLVQYPVYFTGPAADYPKPTYANAGYVAAIPEPDYDEIRT